MTVGIVYQLTFFAALGLLAIVVTVFVFAVSQVGRATESASREQEEILSSQKNTKKGQVERIQKQLDEAKQVGEIDESKIVNELVETENELAGYEAQLEHLQKRIMLIRRKGAVIYPGACFLLVLASSTTASGLVEAQSLPTLALWLWIASVGILAFGIYRMLRTLGAIEEVTITSEEAIEKLPDAVKTALRELEEERRPVLKLEFKDEQPPFRMETQSERLIEYRVHLSGGDIARDASIAFWFQPNFEYVDEVKPLPAPYSEYKDYVSAYFKLGDIQRPLGRNRKLKVKAPSEARRYTAAYKLYCEGYYSDFIEFEIEVEEQEIPF